MKRIIACIAALTLICACILSVQALWIMDYNEDGFIFYYDDPLNHINVRVTGYEGEEKALVIPDRLGGQPVVAVEGSEFPEDLVSVTFPDTVTRVKRESFEKTALFTDPANRDETGALYCGDVLLAVDPEKAGVFTVKEGTRLIAACALEGCERISDIRFPDSVLYICDHAFSGCTGLTNVSLPAGLGVVPTGLFYGCGGLTSVTLSAGVERVDRYAFETCENLEEIRVAEDNPRFCSVEGCLADRSGTLLCVPEGRQGTFTVPAGITALGEYACSRCAKLTRVILPEWVDTLGSGAFAQCTGLTEFEIPATVMTMEDFIFGQCSGLENVKLPEGMTSVPPYMFAHCTSLTRVTVPEGVTAIGEGAFWDCTSLKEISLPSTLTSVAPQAFSETGLAADPSFRDEAGVLYIGDCLIGGGDHMPESYRVREGTRLIADMAFNYFQGLKELILPDSMRYLGNRAFEYCSDLETVSLPEGLAAIGYDAFAYCTALTDIRLPRSLTFVGQGALRLCSALSVVEYAGSSQKWRSLHCNLCILSPMHFALLTGDGDGDERVTSTDARLALQRAVDKIPDADLADPAALDADGDGVFTSTDARLILQKAVGKITEWPCDSEPDPQPVSYERFNDPETGDCLLCFSRSASRAPHIVYSDVPLEDPEEGRQLNDRYDIFSALCMAIKGKDLFTPEEECVSAHYLYLFEDSSHYPWHYRFAFCDCGRVEITNNGRYLCTVRISEEELRSILELL